MFVVKHGKQYCRFGSYSKVDFVPKPEQATLYNRQSDADKRLEDKVGFWNNRVQVDISRFKVFEIEFTSTEREVVREHQESDVTKAVTALTTYLAEKGFLIVTVGVGEVDGVTTLFVYANKVTAVRDHLKKELRNQWWGFAVTVRRMDTAESRGAMIRTMYNKIHGFEFYRSSFNTETGDIVRITDEPQGDSYDSTYYGSMETYVRDQLAKKHGWDYRGPEIKQFAQQWKDKFGRFSHRGRPWSPSPETIDIKIIDWCDFGCSYCYMDSKKNQTEKLEVNDIARILQSFNPLPYQVAYGGGEPCAHPDFEGILKMTRDLGVVPNFTTAGHVWRDSIIEAANQYCGGIALTFHGHKGPEWFAETYKKWSQAFRKQLNVHLIADKDVVENLRALIAMQKVWDSEKYTGFRPQKIKLVLLAYYPDVGRANLVRLMDKKAYNELLPVAINDAIEAGIKISFAEGLIPYFLSRPEIKIDRSFIMPQEGRFSAYIDSKGGFGKSSFEGSRELPDGDYQSAWHSLWESNSPHGDSCYDCALRPRCSTPSTHHYLICKFAPHNGGNPPKSAGRLAEEAALAKVDAMDEALTAAKAAGTVKFKPFPEKKEGETIYIQEFAERIKSGDFTDGDGFGYFAAWTDISDVRVTPSSYHAGFVPEWATFVVWYNQ